MGNTSSSTSNVTNNTTTNNETNYNNIQKSTTNVAVESIMTAAANCGASIAQNQTTSVGNLVARGKGSKIGVTQNQSASLSFTCFQVSDLKNEIQTNMVNKIMQELDTKFSADAKAQMNAAAEAKQANGALSTAIASSSSSNSNVTNNTTTNNVLNTNIQNIVTNNVSQNMETSNLQECISTLVQNQNMNGGNLTALDGGEIDMSQNQEATSLAECKQMSKMSSGIATGVFADLGLSTKNDARTSSDTTASAESKSTQENQGAIDAVGGAISGIIGAVGGVFGSMAAMVIIPIILLCLCCLSLCAMMFMGGSGKSSTSSSTVQEGGSIGKTLYNTGLFDTDYISTMYMLSSTPIK